jgi:hypothetical protein
LLRTPLRAHHGLRLWGPATGAGPSASYCIEFPHDSWVSPVCNDLAQANAIFDHAAREADEQHQADQAIEPSPDDFLDVQLAIERAGGTCLVWAVLREDVYDACLNGGGTWRLESAFWTTDDAFAFVADSDDRMINWHVRAVTLSYDGRDIQAVEPTDLDLRVGHLITALAHP